MVDALVLLFVFLIWLRGTRVVGKLVRDYDRWAYKRSKNK